MITNFKIQYDTDEDHYPFADRVARILNVQDLTRIDEHLQLEEVIVRENDQDTYLHEMFYDNFAAIKPFYTGFVKSVIRPLFGVLTYQVVPTFRIQLPGNLAVGELHTDVQYGHSPHEINVWVPLTPVYESSAVHLHVDDIEIPLFCDYGDVIIFDGGIPHNNVINTSYSTRVSFDFRIIPRRLYSDSTNKSINSGMQFVIGDYFSEFT